LSSRAFPPITPKKGNPWVKPDGTITKECKEALLKELVAFANASGGTLVFGILDKDCCAAGITPVPKAEACAEKLKVACRDSIEPTIPQLEIKGIQTSDDDSGAGVIVFRVNGQSLMGPHRSKADKEFYVRRNDRSDPMTVDEIRRYSISLQNRLTTIENRFEAHSRAISGRMQAAATDKRMFALSCHLIPTAPFQVRDLFPWLRTSFRCFNIDVLYNGRAIGRTYAPLDSLNWTPTVRGAKGTAGHGSTIIEVFAKEDGEVIITWLEGNEADGIVYLTFVIGILANAMILAERLQKRAQCSQAEYLMTFSVHTYSPSQRYGLQGYSNNSFRGLGYIGNGFFQFPTLPITSRDTYNEVCRILDKDFCDYAGYTGQQSILDFDFTPAFDFIDTESRT
jgi:hypothetical protein